MSLRFIVSAALLASQTLSPVEAGLNEPRAFETNLSRAVMVQGQENQHFTLLERMKHFGVSGASIAIVDHCRIVDARGFGTADQSGRSVTNKTLFQAASMSKPLAAVVALKLVEEGKVQLDSDVTHLLPAGTLKRSPEAGSAPVTLRELLRHTAGTTVEGFDGYRPGEPLPTVLQILRGRPPANNDPVRVASTPGKTFSYSGGGYVVVQALLTGASHQPFPQLMRRLVLKPAGMGDSSYAQPLDASHAKLAAQGGGPDGHPMPQKWQIYPELAPAGLWTTPTDYARFMIALARSVRGENHGLLTSRSAAQLMKRGPGNWGLGVDLGPPGAPRQFGHTGSNAGFQSAFIMYPDTCQGAVVMANGDEGQWLITESLRSIGQAYNWPGQSQPSVQSARPLTDAIARTFVGTYRLRDFPTEEFKIGRAADGTLFWARKGHMARDLLPGDANQLFSPDSEMTIDATEKAEDRASVLEVRFGGAKNVAERID